MSGLIFFFLQDNGTPPVVIEVDSSLKPSITVVKNAMVSISTHPYGIPSILNPIFVPSISIKNTTAVYGDTTTTFDDTVVIFDDLTQIFGGQDYENEKIGISATIDSVRPSAFRGKI